MSCIYTYPNQKSYNFTNTPMKLSYLNYRQNNIISYIIDNNSMYINLNFNEDIDINLPKYSNLKEDMLKVNSLYFSTEFNSKFNFTNNIKSIYFTNINNFSKLESNLKSLEDSSVEYLEISTTNFNSNITFNFPKNLKTLNLRNTKISNLFQKISKLDSLEELYMVNSCLNQNINILPENLKILEIDDESNFTITYLNPKLENLKLLVNKDVINYNLSKCINLTEITYNGWTESSLRLAKFPDSLIKLTIISDVISGQINNINKNIQEIIYSNSENKISIYSLDFIGFSKIFMNDSIIIFKNNLNLNYKDITQINNLNKFTDEVIDNVLEETFYDDDMDCFSCDSYCVGKYDEDIDVGSKRVRLYS